MDVLRIWGGRVPQDSDVVEEVWRKLFVSLFFFPASFLFWFSLFLSFLVLFFFFFSFFFSFLLYSAQKSLKDC